MFVFPLSELTNYVPNVVFNDNELKLHKRINTVVPFELV